MIHNNWIKNVFFVEFLLEEETREVEGPPGGKKRRFLPFDFTPIESHVID